ncbi:hypothetical protein DSO57_1027904 [Entomophthora muscae]|uniref:Uncharacterized protein n=1 Tax=Entomophthora muscae TaxID=34485 RepID=A0ACC2RGD1_9FUNG|nr:hypothetical protein DSO57_1027904 [Entomophthora muscae]
MPVPASAPLSPKGAAWYSWYPEKCRLHLDPTGGSCFIERPWVFLSPRGICSLTMAFLAALCNSPYETRCLLFLPVFCVVIDDTLSSGHPSCPLDGVL